MQGATAVIRDLIFCLTICAMGLTLCAAVAAQI